MKTELAEIRVLRESEHLPTLWMVPATHRPIPCLTFRGNLKDCQPENTSVRTVTVTSISPQLAQYSVGKDKEGVRKPSECEGDSFTSAYVISDRSFIKRDELFESTCNSQRHLDEQRLIVAVLK